MDYFVIYGTNYCNAVKVMFSKTDDLLHKVKRFKVSNNYINININVLLILQPITIVSFAMSIFMEVTQTYTKHIDDPTRTPEQVSYPHYIL